MREVEMVDDAAEELFELDVQVVTDVAPGDALAGCKTSDGCAPTCVSSCSGSRS